MNALNHQGDRLAHRNAQMGIISSPSCRADIFIDLDDNLLVWNENKNIYEIQLTNVKLLREFSNRTYVLTYDGAIYRWVWDNSSDQCPELSSKLFHGSKYDIKDFVVFDDYRLLCQSLLAILTSEGNLIVYRNNSEDVYQKVIHNISNVNFIGIMLNVCHGDMMICYIDDLGNLWQIRNNIGEKGSDNSEEYKLCVYTQNKVQKFVNQGPNTLLLMRDGTVSCISYNWENDKKYSIRQLVGIFNICDISVGEDHAMMLSNNGDLFATIGTHRIQNMDLRSTKNCIELLKIQNITNKNYFQNSGLSIQKLHPISNLILDNNNEMWCVGSYDSQYIFGPDHIIEPITKFREGSKVKSFVNENIVDKRFKQTKSALK